ncbi:hypothetical protein FQR65_LT13376 [Abscondita terminalis]|nr:hypothetical protein FQR65_LT13376 [Abscondita terminalis]
MAEIFIDVAPYMFISSRPSWYHEDFMTLEYIDETDIFGDKIYNGPQLYHFTTVEEATIVLRKKTVFSSTTLDSVEQLLVNGATYGSSTFCIGAFAMSAVFPINVAKEAYKDKRNKHKFVLTKNVINKFVKNGGHVYKGVDSKREIFILTKRKLH